MHALRQILVVLFLPLVLISCRPSTTPEPTSPPVPSPTATLHTPPTSEPTDAPVATVPPFPTANEPAPESTFARVGSVSEFESEYGISGRAIVAGLQTLIIQGFQYDGKGPRLDIRLVKGQDYENAVAVLLELDQRAYREESLHMIIPSCAGPGTADTIAIYSPETGQVYATGKFD